MTCAALGLLLRVSYELDRAERQVARLRGEGATPAPEPAPQAPDKPPRGKSPATAQPAPAHATSVAARGTSRLRQRVEPTWREKQPPGRIA
jgi:cell division protein FtsW